MDRSGSCRLSSRSCLGVYIAFVFRNGARSNTNYQYLWQPVLSQQPRKQVRLVERWTDATMVNTFELAEADGGGAEFLKRSEYPTTVFDG